MIELLVAVAIIAILSGVAVTSYRGVQARARDSQRKNDLNQLKIALSTYYNAQVPAKYIASATATTLTGSDSVSTALAGTYIRAVPMDPKNTGVYLYKYSSSTTIGGVADQAFKLTASLENTNDQSGWGCPKTTGWVQDGYCIQND